MIALADPASARSSNLAIALIGLPAARRADALVFFRFCRAVDDIADDAAAPAAERQVRLEEWLEALDSSRGLPAELEKILQTHQLDRSLLRAIVEGCLSDAGLVRFETIEQLRSYCWKVACAVGLVSAKIFGSRSPGSDAFAVHLGYALQLTNICRDVAEDASLNRIYLPRDILQQHGVDEFDVLNQNESPGIRAAVSELAGLAVEEFSMARKAFPQGDAPAFRPACTMAAIYGKILKRIRRLDFRVFSKRVRVSPAEKLAVLAAGLVFPPASMLPRFES
ncbi:MAG: hypothetical protein Fur0032_19560 [Terrimicrobiaceae bacterium]